MQLHAYFSVDQLLTQPLQCVFVLRSRNTERQLSAKILRHLSPPSQNLFVVYNLLVEVVHVLNDA